MALTVSGGEESFEHTDTVRMNEQYKRMVAHLMGSLTEEASPTHARIKTS